MEQDVHRLKYRELPGIRFPVPAVTSILHRLAGVVLFLAIPFLAWLFRLSLAGPDGFARAQAWLQGPLHGLLLFAAAWALLHHLLAGLRFLAIDLGLGVARQPARRTAWLVNVVAPLLALLVAGVWG